MTLPAPFIVGVGRSGTTLLRLMLDAHPLLAIPPETHFLAHIVKAPPCDARQFIDLVTSVHTWGDFHLDAAELAARLVPQHADGSFDLTRAVRMFYTLYAERFSKPRWGDKSPPYVQCIEDLARLIPEACFIHMIRDGRDVALSYKDKWFGPGGQGVGEAARFWKTTILNARVQAAGLPAGRYCEVHFEELVTAPTQTLKRLCRDLQLPWRPQMLDYHRQARQRLDEMGDRTAPDGTIIVPKHKRLSIHEHTHRPPDAGQIEKWRTSLTATEIDQFHAIASDLLQELGYDL